MKLLPLVQATVLLAASASGQVLLEQGKSFTHEFTNLTFYANSTFGVAAPFGSVALYVTPNSPFGLGPNDAYLVELFESTTSAPPALSRLITHYSNFYATDYTTTNLWSDLQGSFRITAVSGSITFRGFSLQAVRTGDPMGFDHFGTMRIWLPPPPVLAIAPCSNVLTVSWPTTATNFVLQSTTGLASTQSWSTVPNPVATNASTYSVQILPTPDTQFFRLKYNGL